MVSLPSPFTMQPLNLKLIPRPVPARAICNHRPRPSRRPPPREAARCRSHLLSVGSGRVHPLPLAKCCIRAPQCSPHNGGAAPADVGLVGTGSGGVREMLPARRVRCCLRRPAAHRHSSRRALLSQAPSALRCRAKIRRWHARSSVPVRTLALPAEAWIAMAAGPREPQDAGGRANSGTLPAGRRHAALQRARPSRCFLPEVAGSFMKFPEIS